MYKDILLPIDLGNESSWNRALPAAIEYCKAFGANLHVLTVMPDFGSPMVAQFFPDDHEGRMMQNANDVLHKFVADRVPDDINVQHVVADGTIYKTIIETAEDINADLIIMGSHRPELQDYLLGPNAARVVRHSSKSVLVVR
jgi:nucleotide-binding universal stress UspA family protein|tara:strand:- start:172 stop:597 length:426 start_codon:yes stop_codon:yes gene_type:complete